ncbi:hypothetical protein F4802DRAFT_2804 [Xylaria palmicola]|nr:hypothetical protein F4802DRAFT_2804 [Xylaria palmicola]
MSSADVFMSSPLRRQNFEPTSVSSSSPYLPSLDEIFRKRSPKKPPPPPQAESHARLSVADILREAPEIDIDTETITSSPPCRTRTPTKNRSRKSHTHSPPNGQYSNQPAVAIESLSPKDKPWQKFKTNPSIQDGDQSQSLANPKAPILKTRPSKTDTTVSRHFTPREGSLLSTIDLTGEGSMVSGSAPTRGGLEDTTQESAVPRRGDWTPPRANNTIPPSSGSDARELFSSAEKAPTSKDVFETLYNQFGRQGSTLTPDPCPPPQPQAEVLRKRKQIEMIHIGQEVKDQEMECRLENGQRPYGQKKRDEPKVPAPKKKARTITELATAPFARPLVPDFELAGPVTEESMLGYFDSDGAVKALVEHQSAVMSQRKPKAKATKPPPKTKRKKKAGTQANPILLSPNSALKQSSNQDFVFGTSSQLVQEESPTTLRDLQSAIRASNALNSDPFDDDVNRRLWHAGARDEDGELMGMEVIDLQYGPAPPGESNSTATPGSRSFVDIHDILDSPVPLASIPAVLSEPRKENAHLFPSQNAGQSSSSVATPSGPESLANASVIEPRPKYELFTDAQLSKQITSYGFKPVKKRAAMIALLDQCWTSKHQGNLGGLVRPLSASARSPTLAPQKSAGDEPDLPATKPRGRGRPKKNDEAITSATKSTTKRAASPKPKPKRSRRGSEKETTPAPTTEPSAAAPSPKRPRGRPRKSSATSVEIPDSESGTPSPVSSPDPVFSSPPPLDLTTSDEGDLSLTLSPTDQQTELFKHITKAVTSAPRSQDPSKPSWYEKMLLYDPIILEEFASWLNRGELTRVGYDGEVSPPDAKKWCESRSVICLWRHNIRGKERKRY